MLNHDLIPIRPDSIGSVRQLTVDARRLHASLQVKREFSHWIKARIDKYGFVEGEDFEKSSIISCSPKKTSGDFKGLQQPIEYTLSLNMGKELAMIENNEIGRMARRYFIACERKAMEALRAPQPVAALAPFLPPPRYLSPASRRRLTSLVDAKIADVPSHHVWRARMRVWISLKRRFSIPQYRLLPEERLPDAIAFLSSLEIGPHGKVVTDDQQALPMRSTDDMRQVASALTHLIAQAKTLLPLLQTATPEVCA